MNKLHKLIIILGIIMFFITIAPSDYFEKMENSYKDKKIIVINNQNLSLLVKYINQDKFLITNFSEWKKTKKPFDIFINWANLNIGNIEKELILIEQISNKANSSGKIINLIEDKTNMGACVLIKKFSDLANKYYMDSIGFCTINMDIPINTQTMEFICDNSWNKLASRVFSNKLIKEKSAGYLLGISESYSKSNLLINKISQNKFNGETVIIPDIEQKELTIYSNNSGILVNKLSQIHSVKTNQIQFHNGIMNFLQIMIPVFVPESFDIICWQMSYLTQIAKSRNIIHVNSVIANFNAIPDYTQILNNLSSKTRMIYLTGPINKNTFDNFIKSVPENILVIIDFCYDGFQSEKSNIRMEDCIQYKNYVLGINTFSKANGLAGVHLSYSIGHEEIQTIIANYFYYPINQFYEKLAVKSLDADYLNKVKQHYASQANKLSKILEENKIPHWFELVTTIQIDISKLNTQKILENLNKTGLSNYYKIIGNYIKIFISTDEINSQLIKQIIS